MMHDLPGNSFFMMLIFTFSMNYLLDEETQNIKLEKIRKILNKNALISLFLHLKAGITFYPF
jgi:hypothetical protein